FNLYFLPCEADADTSFAWTSYSDIDSLWDHVSSESMTKTEFELENESDDSMVFLIDITDITENSSKIKAWENGINTGLFIDFNGSEKFMQAWYSRDYLEGAYAPVLELICDIMDSTTNTTTYDTTLFLEASADLTHSINDKIGEENNLYISSGNIYQSSFVMPALTDSLVNNNILIVQAELTCNISNVFCRESDSLMVFLLIKEENSIDSTVYDVIGDLVVSDTLTVDDTALSFHADNLVQYLIGGGRTTETRLYFEFASKYEEYSHITLDESSFSVNLIYAELE
ncbi:MAG: hypothetical protein KAI81_06215, partial [Candidatus Marinimicrobia bacterium]|nr:hypothetical protein [Candidatus Neomarinimicrobiota bacterium]